MSILFLHLLSTTLIISFLLALVLFFFFTRRTPEERNRVFNFFGCVARVNNQRAQLASSLAHAQLPVSNMLLSHNYCKIKCLFSNNHHSITEKKLGCCMSKCRCNSVFYTHISPHCHSIWLLMKSWGHIGKAILFYNIFLFSHSNCWFDCVLSIYLFVQK